jgi:hypothetical protein
MSLSVGSLKETVPGIVPSVTTDRIENSFLSRQAKATSVPAAVTTLSCHDGHTQG